MQLITYANRLGGDLRGLHALLRDPLQGLFSGIHILPFFDPIDHTRVDPRIGDWQDIAALSDDCSVMADLIVNHVSSDSPQFQDVRRIGSESQWWDRSSARPTCLPAANPSR